MSWIKRDEQLDKLYEEKRELLEYLIDKPCMFCFYRKECDFVFDYEHCNMGEYEDE